MTSVEEPVLDWPSVNESWTGIRDESGSIPSREKDPRSDSCFPTDQTGALQIHILIVEDNAADVLLIRRAIANAGLNAEIHIVGDGEAAIRAFDAYDADLALTCPDLVILDIKLSQKAGRRGPRTRAKFPALFWHPGYRRIHFRRPKRSGSRGKIRSGCLISANRLR